MSKRTLSEILQDSLHLEMDLESHIDPETGEISGEYDIVESMLESTEEELFDKLNRYAWVRKNANLDKKSAEAKRKELQELIDEQRHRENAAQRKIDWLTSQMMFVLNAKGIEKKKLDHFSMTVVRPKTKNVSIYDADAIPFDLCRVEPNKTKIKEALESGQDVIGAKLVDRDPYLLIRG